MALSRPPRADTTIYFEIEAESGQEAELTAVMWASQTRRVKMAVGSLVTDWPEEWRECMIIDPDCLTVRFNNDDRWEVVKVLQPITNQTFTWTAELVRKAELMLVSGEREPGEAALEGDTLAKRVALADVAFELAVTPHG